MAAELDLALGLELAAALVAALLRRLQAHW